MQTFELNIQLCPSSVAVQFQSTPVASVFIADEVTINTNLESYIPLVVTLNSEVIGT